MKFVRCRREGVTQNESSTERLRYEQEILCCNDNFESMVSYKESQLA